MNWFVLRVESCLGYIEFIDKRLFAFQKMKTLRSSALCMLIKFIFERIFKKESVLKCCIFGEPVTLSRFIHYLSLLGTD